jgi:adenylate kinase family enzyme
MIANLDQINFSKLRKVNIVGTTGAGKTFLAKRMSEILALDYLEIDQIFWGPNWAKPTNRDFYDRLKLELEKSKGFILDGNYTKTTSLKWAHSETIIWVHPGYFSNLGQLVIRTILRVATRKELWRNTGNRESIYAHLFTKDSIFYWFYKTHKGNELKFASDMRAEQWRHLQFIELKSNAEIKKFLKWLELEAAKN